MGKVVAKKVVTRKKGYLYYVDAKGNVCEAKMARGGRKKKASSRRRTAARRTAARRTTRRRTAVRRRRR
jgi:hypothetical protein